MDGLCIAEFHLCASNPGCSALEFVIASDRNNKFQGNVQQVSEYDEDNSARQDQADVS